MLCQNFYMFGGGQKQGSLSWFGLFSLADTSGFCDVTKGDYVFFLGTQVHCVLRQIWSDCSSLIANVAAFVLELKGVFHSNSSRHAAKTSGSRLIRPVRAEFLPGWMINEIVLLQRQKQQNVSDLGRERERERDNSHASAFLNYELNKLKFF